MNFNNIPPEMKKMKNWVCWKLEEGKKIPYHLSGEKASTTDPKDWNTFDNIFNNAYFRKYKFDGIGFVFTEKTEFVGVDFDHIRDPKTGTIDPESLVEIKAFNSYTEISQSGTGVHIICRGTLPVDGRKIGNREMYKNKRFFALTGNVLDGYPKMINEAQEAINKYYTKWFPEKEKSTMEACKSPVLSDSEVISLCRSAKNKDKFIKLFDEGNKEDYKNEKGEIDDSIADCALCSLIAFYTQDPEQIDNIFQKSGLYREKWNRIDYKHSTISRALNGLTAIYKKEEEVKEISLADFKNIKLDSNDRRMPNLMNILPQEHFINIVTGWMSGLSDTYYEYQVSSALWLLSDLIQGKGSLKLKQGTLKPNLYITLLGQSSKSRKSTAVKKIKNIRESATDSDLYNDEPTIEGYLEMLSKEPIQSFVCDEVSGLLAKFHKKYNDGVFDLDCKIYDGDSVRKVMASGKNATVKEFIVKDPYVTHLYATTPDKFISVMTLEDFLCGWGYRFLYAFPTYTKERMDIEEENNENIEAWGKTMEATRGLYLKFYSLDHFNFAISEDALNVYNEICREFEDAAETMQNESLDSAIARAEDNILKIAMLLEIGKHEPSFEITQNSIKVASSLIYDFYLPSFMQIMDRIMSDVKNNKIEKAISIIRRSGGSCTVRKLSQNGHFYKKEAEELIESMVWNGILSEVKIKENGAIHYVLNTEKNSFKVNSTELSDMFTNFSKNVSPIF